jgi:tripartite-type tricarboxylate transporter receptor subunit TctC
MNARKLGLLCALTTLCVFVAVGTVAAADAFPAKDITLICPWSAGGGTDTVARSLVKNAKKHFGVNVNVVNKTGGMGAVGMGAAATARPDGYTVGMITFQLSTFQSMGLAKLSYRDYNLIQLVNQSPAAISVAADSKWKNLKQLMDYAKENPGIVTVGHSGAGGAWHLAIASIAVKNDIQFNYVPFDGAAPTRTALIGEHIDCATTGIDEMLQLYQAGKVRILAVNNTTRHALFPDVPTMEEAGYPNPNPILDWRGLAAPKGVSPENMTVLIDGFKKCFDDPEFQELAKKLGLPLVYKDPAGFEDFLQGMEETLVPALESVGLYNPM